jgi:hypothetical protein
MARGESLYSLERECFICHNPTCEVHHVYGGVGRRDISDREGCWVYLCRPHHQGNAGVHGNAEMMRWLRADCQRRWERREGLSGDEAHDAFRKVFGISYL